MSNKRARNDAHKSAARRERYKDEPRITGDKMTPAQIASLTARLTFDPATGCLLWTGSLNDDGYGQVVWRGKKYLVHRLWYEHIKQAPIEDGLELDHTCECRACAWHGEPVTHAENIRRVKARDALPLPLFAYPYRLIRDEKWNMAHLESIQREDAA